MFNLALFQVWFLVLFYASKSMIANSEWITYVRCKDIEFRILKRGDGSSAYDRGWKAAHVSFSSKGQIYLMTVEYLYGKRIDISVSRKIICSMYGSYMK